MSGLWGHISVEDILSPINGVAVSGGQQAILSGLSTDSRTVGPGELFWALSGERYDGHDFLKEAFDCGAVGAVVQEDTWRAKGGDRAYHLQCHDRAIITVADTLTALGDLAGWWRHRHHALVTAITGSTGKTTTKEMAALILGLEKETLKNVGNLNNLIGLPMSLLNLHEGHGYAVLEMGMNRPGEIARLTEIADPDVGLITNVGGVHLEGLGDIDGVAKAKCELVENISARGQVVLNGDDALLMKTALAFKKEVITFGTTQSAHVRASGVENLGAAGVRFVLQLAGESWPVRLRCPGLQNIPNALAAAAIGLCLQVSPEHISEGIAQFKGTEGRFMVGPLPGGVLLIDDTYNANPLSLKAACDSVKSLVHDPGRLIVGLGEMMELGKEAGPAHLEAGGMAARLGAHCFLAMGKHAPDMVQGAIDSGMPVNRAKVVTTHDEMVKQMVHHLQEGDVIFLKGSRKMHLEKVIEGLKKALASFS